MEMFLVYCCQYRYYWEDLNLNTPSTGSPFSMAIFLFMRRTAPAPSLTWLALPTSTCTKLKNVTGKYLWFVTVYKIRLIPAVVLPSFLNAGLSCARPARDVFGRIPSSTETVICFSSPLFGSTIFMAKHYQKKWPKAQEEATTKQKLHKNIIY